MSLNYVKLIAHLNNVWKKPLPVIFRLKTRSARQRWGVVTSYNEKLELVVVLLQYN